MHRRFLSNGHKRFFASQFKFAQVQYPFSHRPKRNPLILIYFIVFIFSLRAFAAATAEEKKSILPNQSWLQAPSSQANLRPQEWSFFIQQTSHLHEIKMKLENRQNHPQLLPVTQWQEVNSEREGWEWTSKFKNKNLKVRIARSITLLPDQNDRPLAMTTFSMTKNLEDSRVSVFSKNKLLSFTSCAVDPSQWANLGRVCLTVTQNLCRGFFLGKSLSSATLQEMQRLEILALMEILDLRGNDHQLENIVRYGNRFGVHTQLQTTQGQLVSLSNRLNKELNQNPTTSHGPTNKGLDAKKNEPVREVLEANIPKIKVNCEQAGFMTLANLAIEPADAPSQSISKTPSEK